MEDSKYDGLFTTDKNLIQTVIESSPYSEEIDPKVILNINKQLILSSYPKSYGDITTYQEFYMLVKYLNIFFNYKKVTRILKKTNRKVEDDRFLIEWADLHLISHKYSEEDFPEDPVGSAEDYV
jgi:hypothetical protein